MGVTHSKPGSAFHCNGGRLPSCPSARSNQREIDAGPLRQRLTCFSEEDVAGKVGEAQLRVDTPSLVETPRTEPAISEPITEAIHVFSSLTFISNADTSQSNRSDVLGDGFVHFNQNETAVTPVIAVDNHHRVGRRS